MHADRRRHRETWGDEIAAWTYDHDARFSIGSSQPGWLGLGPNLHQKSMQSHPEVYEQTETEAGGEAEEPLLALSLAS